MSPTRRTLLRTGALAACGAAAGCLSSAGNRTERPPAASVAVESTEEPTAVVEHDVAVVDRHATNETPPRIRVTLRNTGDEPVTVGEARTARFELATSESAGPELLLLPSGGGYGTVADTDGETADESSDDGCWKFDEQLVQTAEFRTLRLDPGEVVQAKHDVRWRDREGSFDGCFPTGEFRFACRFGVTPGGERVHSEETEQHEWGFSLAVTEP